MLQQANNTCNDYTLCFKISKIVVLQFFNLSNWWKDWDDGNAHCSDLVITQCTHVLKDNSFQKDSIIPEIKFSVISLRCQHLSSWNHLILWAYTQKYTGDCQMCKSPPFTKSICPKQWVAFGFAKGCIAELLGILFFKKITELSTCCCVYQNGKINWRVGEFMFF